MQIGQQSSNHRVCSKSEALTDDCNQTVVPFVRFSSFFVYLCANEIFDGRLGNPQIKRMIQDTRKGNVKFCQPQMQSRHTHGEGGMSNR